MNDDCDCGDDIDPTDIHVEFVNDEPAKMHVELVGGPYCGAIVEMPLCFHSLMDETLVATIDGARYTNLEGKLVFAGWITAGSDTPTQNPGRVSYLSKPLSARPSGPRQLPRVLATASMLMRPTFGKELR